MRDKAIDSYIKTFPHNVQTILQKIRRTIRKIIPQAEETISYAIPTFKLNGKYVIYFAGFKNHIGMYPILSVNKTLEKELLPYKKGKATVQFQLDKPIPYELITKIVLSRAKSVIQKAKQK